MEELAKAMEAGGVLVRRWAMAMACSSSVQADLGVTGKVLEDTVAGRKLEKAVQTAGTYNESPSVVPVTIGSLGRVTDISL